MPLVLPILELSLITRCQLLHITVVDIIPITVDSTETEAMAGAQQEKERLQTGYKLISRKQLKYVELLPRET